MALYKCEIINEKGKKKTKRVNAIDEVDLKVQLHANNLILVKYKVLPEKKYSSFFTMSMSVKRSEVVVFLRQFSVMINAGISVDDTLATLRLQKFTKGMREKVTKIYQDVVSGVLLSEAFRIHKDVFPEFFCNMLEIGEVSGSLDVVLDSMADYYENDERLKKKAKSSLAYPTVLVVLIFAVIVFMSYVILPQFAEMFAEFGGEIPKFTQIVLAVADFIKKYLLFMMGGALLLVGILFLFFRTKKGRYIKDWISINIIILGKINNAIVTARFARAFAILLKSGMNLTYCMDNLVNILGNEVYRVNFKKVIEEVKMGKSINKSMDDAKVFNKLLVQMISVGERSGNLEDVLDSTSMFFDSQVDSDINKAISLLEPITIIFLGVVVAVVLLSVYVPMIDLMKQI